ncbi:PAS domain S-box protein [Ekhidna sp.]|uniref:PAS domain S-box protein n=1 Tax=Ekhidna sp. TaxID=2608089 RepID=UPI0032995CB4
MKNPPIPSNEKERLIALDEYQILDTLPEQSYDDITKIASQICDTPIALISLIDQDRQWFKSHHGLGVTETPRQLAYCAHAINEPDEILEVPDAFKDDRFHDNPLATGDPHVRFYAGAPLTDDQGFTLGTLCVIDHEERNLSTGQKDALWALSRQVVALLQLRKENIKRTQISREFTSMMENLGDGVFELDENGKCTYANSRMLEMLGKKLEEVINTSIWDMIYSEDVGEMKSYYGKQFKNKTKKCRYEYRLKPQKGEPIWISQNTTMEYEEGRMVRLRSISRDITATKKLAEELKEKESLYKLVSENSTDLIALHEPDGRYKYISPSVEDLLGYQMDELLGKSPYEYIHPDDVSRLQRGPHDETLDGNSIEQIEYRIKKSDGSYLWMESYTKPILNEKGEVLTFQTSSRDISDKKAEQLILSKHLDGLTLLNELAGLPSTNDIILDIALQKVAEHLELNVGILSQIADDSLTIKNLYNPDSLEIDTQKKYNLSNSCCDEVYSKSEVYLVSAKTNNGVINHPCLPEKTKVYAGALIIKNGKKYGTIDFLSTKSAQNFTYYDKEFLQLFANWIGSILEAQEEKELLKSARKNAETASEAKDSFLSMMSHEIRTPLNGIIGTTHLLLSKSPNESQIPYLKMMEQSSNNLMSILNDILDFGKIEEGKIKMDKISFNLHELASSIHNNYKIQGDEKGINVSLAYDDSLSEFYLGDTVRISQILHNLLSNAVKFTHEGQVILTLHKENSHDNFDEILFSIEDSGVGIPEEKQHEIFDVFTQADKATTREFGGSGLGLTITKRLLELMNSSIHLDSTVDAGSTFSFKLIMSRSSEKLGEHGMSGNAVGFQKLEASILLVDDNLFNRAIAKDFLESWGCAVLEAGDGSEALNVLEKNTIDLVLLDLQMPVMDGYETIKVIRSHKLKTIKQLPVVALTAAAMGDIESKVYQSGMDGFITKPFHPTDFYQKLSIHLNPSMKIEAKKGIELRILDKLQQTLGADEKRIDKYLDVFHQTLKEEYGVLSLSIEEENLLTIKSYAHKNKSSLLLGGLEELGNDAEELEEMINLNMPKSRILEKALNHQKEIGKVLEELKINE